MIRGPARLHGLPALAALLAAALLAGCGESGADTRPAERGDVPNLLVVLSDDQTPDSLERMPYLSSRRDWLRFDRAFVHQGMCCPSRATLLSGLYSHRSGVEDNSLAPEFRDGDTLATWLDAAGYETGLFGKYMNEFPWDRPRDYVPPGWDRWVSFWGPPRRPRDYYRDARYSLDGRVTPRISAYSTEYLARRAVRFVESAPEPFAALFAPYAAHEPATPGPGGLARFRRAQVELPANFNRGGSGFFRRLPDASAPRVRGQIRREWAALRAVDRAVATLVATLRRRGVLGRTIVLYTSDNGLSHGSHRWTRKNCVYEECVQVPLLVRYPGSAGRVREPVSNVDLAPTLAELGGARPTLRPDGRSLVPLLEGEGAGGGRALLLRSSEASRALLLRSSEASRALLLRSSEGEGPGAWALRTRRWKYIEYESGEVELYDLRDDPHELRDLAARPRSDGVRDRLAARLREERDAEAIEPAP